jgi:RNA polymerase sigma-70 factor (ECF subfamily)
VRTLKELISNCLNKDTSAWSEFVLRFKPLVENSVRARLGRHNFPHTIEDIKDIAQDILLGIWEQDKLQSVRDEDKITGWLVIVAQNATVDYIRKHKDLLRQNPGIIGEEGSRLDITETFVSNSHPVRETLDKELADTLDSALNALQPRDKLILKLSLSHNLSHKEIAGLTQIPLNTVSTIIRRSLLKLRELLKKWGFSLEK